MNKAECHIRSSSEPIVISNNQEIITGLRKELIRFRMKMSIVRIAISSYNNPIDWFRSLRYIVRLKKRINLDKVISKLILFEGKYYSGLYTPSWNGFIFRSFITTHLNAYKTVEKGTVNAFNTVYLALTKKCILQCEHCYEGDSLNQKDSLSTDNFQHIVEILQQKGVSQIHLTGGEPFLEIDRILSILKHAKKNTEFWIDTSGYNLTSNNAKKLKEAGLTGVVVSLDHFIPEKHNAFRHSENAFYWVEKALKNAAENQLMTALSLCATKDFISPSNLMQYMELAKKLQVSFVQILEPKDVGHYNKKDVKLERSHTDILNKFFIKMNYNKEYESFPIIMYFEYYQRKHGCLNLINKNIYIDADGKINSCPFCHNKIGSILDANIDKHLDKLKLTDCKRYIEHV